MEEGEEPPQDRACEQEPDGDDNRCREAVDRLSAVHEVLCLCAALVEDWRRIADNYYGDYYPLTPYSLAEDAWMAWQFNRPEVGAGMVQAFARPETFITEARFRLRDLEPEGRYRITDIDAMEAASIATGREMMESGLPIRIARPPAAKILIYERVGLAAAY